MKIAVLTATRDRLDYTKHCFASLRENAGCEFDHFVFDQGSRDGTRYWLVSYRAKGVFRNNENIGLCPALNYLLALVTQDTYDVIVRFDNDCEVTQPDTLRVVCEVADEYEAIVAPRVLGLLHPPPTLAEAQAGEHIIEVTDILGGIFMAIPGRLFYELGYRYDESFPPWTGDEAIVPWWRAQGGVAGYLRGFSVNHFEGTLGQRQRHPDYWTRKDMEMAVP